MFQSLVKFASLLICLAGSAVVAQEMPQMEEASVQHEWLDQFVGEWTTEMKGSMGEDQPAMECEGVMKSRKLGEFWVINELTGDIAGTTMNGIQTIGYDSAKEKYVGTWVDSMANYMWRYEGTVDKSGKKLSLEAEGPNFMAGDETMTQFRDSYEFKTPDHIIATSEMMTGDGKWVTFMQGEMKRSR